MSINTATGPVILPLIPSRPRLRFIAGAPDGAAGTPTPATAETPAPTAEETSPSGEETPPVDEETPGSESLGDPGKKALDAMKQKWKDADKRANTTAAELAALKAAQDGREAEHQAELKNQRIRDEALAKANDRILKAEVRAVAASKLADPEDALRFIDLSSFEVGEEGDVDRDTLTAAIDDLISSKPYLAAQSGGRFQGSGDGGARNESRAPQLSQVELDRMTPEQIVAARKEGRLNQLMGITT